jgi:hypothetical protein
MRRAARTLAGGGAARRENPAEGAVVERIVGGLHHELAANQREADLAVSTRYDH